MEKFGIVILLGLAVVLVSSQELESKDEVKLRLLKRLMEFEKANKHETKRATVEETIHDMFKDLWDLTVSNSDTLYGDLSLYDMEVVELIMEMEKEFCIAVPDDVAAKWVTVQDIIDYVEEHKHRK